MAGSFKSGRGPSGTGIGALTSIAFTGCKAEGVAITVMVHTSAANPAPINLTQEFPAGSSAHPDRCQPARAAETGPTVNHPAGRSANC